MSSDPTKGEMWPRYPGHDKLSGMEAFDLSYPEGNPGVYPVDPESDVGRFRILYQIQKADRYTPDEPGYAHFHELSDVDIEVYIEQGGGSVTRGVGYYLMAQAAQAAQESKLVKDYDLSVDLRGRATEFRLAATQWFNRADSEELGFGDIFEIHSPGESDVIPEGSPVRYGRIYEWGQVF